MFVYFKYNVLVLIGNFGLLYFVCKVMLFDDFFVLYVKLLDFEINNVLCCLFGKIMGWGYLFG